ncbi:hypothetical protein HYU07_07080 [Candidatus Woesearchaeota archaeon]|nr:hypothetical protein [Candidatus Woesearchaeota archaeon]
MNKLDYAINSCKISVILILVLTALFRIFIMLNPSITSYAVIVENAYSEDLNLSISQSSEQTIALQNPGELSSLKISGNVIGIIL